MDKKSTVIITGINGQLGQFMTKYLQENEANIKIVGTIRHKSYDKQPYIFDKSKVAFELMDLSDSHSIENLILKYKPEYFINTSANAYVGESWAVPVQQIELNTLGVLHQLEAIRKHSPYTRYFNMGTSEEFGNDNNDGRLQDENTLINPKSPYGCSKAAARYLVNTYRNSYNLYAIQGWTFNFESELRGCKYVSKWITLNVARIYHAIKNNQDFKPLKLGNIYSVRSWQFCGDVADGIWRQLNQERYNKELDPQNINSKLYHNFCDANNIGHTDTGFENTEELEKWLKLYNDRLYKFWSKNIKTYVMSSSGCYTVKDLVELAFKNVEINGKWVGSGIDEKFISDNNKILMEIDKSRFRPHDVSYLNGDATAIKRDLKWNSTLSFEQLVKRMVQYDVENYDPNLCI